MLAPFGALLVFCCQITTVTVLVVSRTYRGYYSQGSGLSAQQQIPVTSYIVCAALYNNGNDVQSYFAYDSVTKMCTIGSLDASLIERDGSTSGGASSLVIVAGREGLLDIVPLGM